MPDRRTAPLAAALAGAVLCLFAALPAAAQHDGYHYPEVTSEEVFDRTLLRSDSNVSRDVRIAFITQLTKAQMEAPANPRFAIFAKGAEAEHMIIVALDDTVFATLYRARAVLAQLTSQSRDTEFFVNNSIETSATWFDLAKLLGFSDLVITDGDAWAHRVLLRD